MKQYKFDDFKIGNTVYHTTNTKVKMIVIDTLSETRNIKCRWLDKDGVDKDAIFLFNELMNSDDYRSGARMRYGPI